MDQVPDPDRSVDRRSADRRYAALARIEAALVRIEAAARRTPAPVAPGDAALTERHQRLRAAAGAALAELDQLIEGLAR